MSELLHDIPVSASEPLRKARRIVIYGVGSLLLWSVFAQLEQGAVAPGEVVPADYTKTLQHLEGGMVKEIKIKDGDRVTPGQELIVLDDTEARASTAILEYQLAAQQALVERLAAERDGKPLPANTGPSGKVPAVETQLRLFEARRNSLRRNLSILGERLTETRAEVTGLQRQQSALKTQLDYAAEQNEMLKKLHEKNFISKPQLLDRSAQMAQVQANAGNTDAELAKAKQKVVETELEIDRTKNQWLNDVLEQLRVAQTDLSGIQEKLGVAKERLSHMRITAPHEGTVKGLRLTNAGAVIPPNSPVLDIVPDKEKLVIEASMSPDDIDLVHPGLEAHVQLSAYKARYHRSLDGAVTRVSADTYRDNQNNAPARSFYRVRIEIGEEELKQYPDLRLTPGMQAQVTIVTGSRSPLRYLFDPVRQTFSRSFKEK